MDIALSLTNRIAPAIRALQTLAELDHSECTMLETAIARRRHFGPRHEILAEGAVLQQPLLMLEGWAYRTHLLADGRRQIIQFLLPGDLLGTVEDMEASASVIALTEASLCTAPSASNEKSGLGRAYAAARALDERYLFRQITRLGRLSAYERLVDWFCEIHERLTRSQSCGVHAMTLPVTQEMMADTLGLTNVHINRTLQALRRDGIIETVGKTVRLLDRDACQTVVGHRIR